MVHRFSTYRYTDYNTYRQILRKTINIAEVGSVTITITTDTITTAPLLFLFSIHFLILYFGLQLT